MRNVCGGDVDTAECGLSVGVGCGHCKVWNVCGWNVDTAE